MFHPAFKSRWRKLAEVWWRLQSYCYLKITPVGGRVRTCCRGWYTWRFDTTQCTAVRPGARERLGEGGSGGRDGGGRVVGKRVGNRRICFARHQIVVMSWNKLNLPARTRKHLASVPRTCGRMRCLTQTGRTTSCLQPHAKMNLFNYTFLSLYTLTVSFCFFLSVFIVIFISPLLFTPTALWINQFPMFHTRSRLYLFRV